MSVLIFLLTLIVLSIYACGILFYAYVSIAAFISIAAGLFSYFLLGSLSYRLIDNLSSRTTLATGLWLASIIVSLIMVYLSGYLFVTWFVKIAEQKR
jgi:hypothetical protein